MWLQNVGSVIFFVKVWFNIGYCSPKLHQFFYIHCAALWTPNNNNNNNTSCCWTRSYVGNANIKTFLKLWSKLIKSFFQPNVVAGLSKREISIYFYFTFNKNRDVKTIQIGIQVKIPAGNNAAELQAVPIVSLVKKSIWKQIFGLRIPALKLNLIFCLLHSFKKKEKWPGMSW